MCDEAFNEGRRSAPPGTAIKFKAPTGSDVMMIAGVLRPVGTALQCVTVMKEYENKSLEELRLEDYKANRKNGSSKEETTQKKVPGFTSSNTNCLSNSMVKQTQSLFSDKDRKDSGAATPSFDFGTSTLHLPATTTPVFSPVTAAKDPSTTAPIPFSFGTPTNKNLTPFETTSNSVKDKKPERLKCSTTSSSISGFSSKDFSSLYPRSATESSLTKLSFCDGAEGSTFNFGKPTNQQSNQQPNSSATRTLPPNHVSSQKEDPAASGDLEVVGKLSTNYWPFPTKYIWTIEELPEREGFYGVASPKFSCGIEEWCMCLYSSGLPSGNTKIHEPPSNSLALVFKNIEPRVSIPEDVILAIVPHSNRADILSGANHWKMDVKLIDKMLLKSFRCRKNFKDKILRARYFVLPFELAERIRSPFDKKRSIICELSCEPGEPNAETDTQTDLTSGIHQLSGDLKQLLTSGDASDATVRVKGRDFPVHRIILAARTPVFSSMFKHKMSERETGVVNIDDCEPDTFERFLEYVYTGKVEDLSSVNAIALYEVADKYQMKGLKADCLESIKDGLSVMMLCSAVSLALRHDETELTKLASDFFSLNIEDILTTVEWQNFLAENPTHANELLIKAHRKK